MQSDALHSLNVAESVSLSHIIKLGNEFLRANIELGMSKELRNTPDLWIFIYIFGPENDSCLWVDILALLLEEASLSSYVCFCSSFTKARSFRKTLGE